MSRLSPSLLYLAVYNPTLRPSADIPNDDEDAEEQARILFYTSNERAVSRDRMLRQVGLARALVNFSEMFGRPSETCENVHSQSRRMFMVNPEFDFWIHAAIELAKTPRIPLQDKKKDKAAKLKAKGRAKDTPPPRVVYDYHDGSVDDLAVRTYLMQGYERFKLLHGSFGSILTSLGQQALELQLERFFTVWAWSWDVSREYSFSEHLGTSFHPLHHILRPHIDEFVATIDPHMDAMVMCSSHSIPSTSYAEAAYPPALARYLRTFVAPRKVSSKPQDMTSSQITVKPGNQVATTQEQSASQANKDASLEKLVSASSSAASGFLNTLNPMPAFDATIDAMDVRKWTWPFGKNPTKKASVDVSLSKKIDQNSDKPTIQPPIAPSSDAPSSVIPSGDKHERQVSVAGSIDTPFLKEAIESENVQSSRTHTLEGLPAHSSPSMVSVTSFSAPPSEVSIDDLTTPSASRPPPESLPDPLPSSASDQLQETTTSSGDQTSSEESEASAEVLTRPTPVFASKVVRVWNEGDPTETRRKRVYYFTDNALTIALIAEEDVWLDATTGIARRSVSLLNRLQTIIDEKAGTMSPGTPQFSMSKILQPKDMHVLSAHNWTSSTSGFDSHSEHLYRNRALLLRERDVAEVYARGQHPQFWHISRRNLGNDAEGRPIEGEAHMEISRKEASLTDVDNALTSATRKFPPLCTVI